MARSTKVRKGMPSVQLTKAEFARRFRSRFYDPAFDAVADEIEKVIEKAWDGYHQYRKSPRTREAGRGFADPGFKLPIEWLETRKAVQAAEKRQKARQSPSRVLLINGSSRTDQSCPGEMSKTFRLVTMAKQAISGTRGFEVDLLDLSRLTSEYGRVIFIRARHASPRQCRSATGHAPATQITPWVKSVTGWRKFTRVGRLLTAS